MMRTQLGWLAAFVALVVTIGVANLTRTDSAEAVFQVGPGACNEQGGGIADPAFCTWDGSGVAPKIGANSCTEPFSCIDLGGNVRINPLGLPWFEGSCNGFDACSAAANFEALSGSCNGEEACWGGRVGGTFKAAGNSCNGTNACREITGGDGGSFEAGHGSCNGIGACFTAGGNFGYFNAGHNTCNGDTACDSAGFGGSAAILSHSCNFESACDFAGSSGDASIGKYSCNGDFPECASATADVGNCEFNDSQPVECIFLGPLFASPLWQQLLAIFTFFDPS